MTTGYIYGRSGDTAQRRCNGAWRFAPSRYSVQVQGEARSSFAAVVHDIRDFNLRTVDMLCARILTLERELAEEGARNADKPLDTKLLREKERKVKELRRQLADREAVGERRHTADASRSHAQATEALDEARRQLAHVHAELRQERERSATQEGTVRELERKLAHLRGELEDTRAKLHEEQEERRRRDQIIEDYLAESSR